MPSKILPIKPTPSITSYVHHAYPNAIISNDRIASLYIQSLKSHNWIFQENDILYSVDEKSNIIHLKDQKGRTSSSFFLKRRCKKIDEIIVKINDIKLLDSLTYVRLSISSDSQFYNQNDDDFFIRWNQYDITLNDSHISYDSHLFQYYKLHKSNDLITISISADKKKWTKIYSKNYEQNNLENIFFFIKIYYGENQYEQWKNMNYIQLVYDENDDNGVYLDYFMFPRKNSDASYHYLCHFLDTEYEDLNSSLALYDGIHQYLKHNINKNFYINICLDEYYIPERYTYTQSHYMHYNLIYGYDDNLKQYYVLGYNSKGKLATSTFPYDSLNIKIYENSIVKYRYNANKYKYNFNTYHVIQSIREYYYGIDSSIKYCNLLAPKSGLYGINIFNKLRSTEHGKQLLIHDLRISFVLYEHCKLMLDRLDYMLKQTELENDEKNDICAKCIKMSKDAEILKNMVIKNSITHSCEQKIHPLIDNLYYSQKDFYSTLLEIYEKNNTIP